MKASPVLVSIWLMTMFVVIRVIFEANGRKFVTVITKLSHLTNLMKIIL